MSLTPESNIVIIGAGCFGLSTAYHLLKRGYRHVTVLDRSPVLPAPEAASCDMNRVVRSAYSDSFYAGLAREAMAEWRKTDEWGDAYHESGVVFVFDPANPSAEIVYTNDDVNGARAELLHDSSALRSAFPDTVEVASFQGSRGYLNRDGGWANAKKATAMLLEKVERLGAKVRRGTKVVELVRRDIRTTAVKCQSGEVIDADLVVLATGAWTASSFPGLDLERKCVATGQCIVTIQLSPEEAEAYRACPVVMNKPDKFYCFPPTEEGIFKCATHAGGYTNMQPTGNEPVSVPQFLPAENGHGSRIPREAVQELRALLANVYPSLAKKPFSTTRMCWYTDSLDDDFVIGRHPNDPGVMLATAGNGHAYKFLPVIGRVVADAIEHQLPPDVARKFAVGRPDVAVPQGRARERKILDLGQLCTAGDLVSPRDLTRTYG